MEHSEKQCSNQKAQWILVCALIKIWIKPLIAQKIILGNTVNPPIESNSIHKLGNVIQETYEQSISLENVFNKRGVCRVVAQIILSIFSLNTKESGKLNDIGKIEASRAVIAYMTSWTAK